MIAKGKQSNKLLAYQWLRVGSKKFIQRGHSRFPARRVLPVREHRKVARTPSCLFHPERWVICFQPIPTSQYGGLKYQMTIDRLRTYIPVPPSIDGGCLNGIIQVAPFFMAEGGLRLCQRKVDISCDGVFRCYRMPSLFEYLERWTIVLAKCLKAPLNGPLSLTNDKW